ncbi:type 1 glutamine amidotransferase-like domain-containing protein [Clostridium sp. P21]|uniref:Type 1 glutamine amidotransferase-like domain-containing protein n=1 Tax=Clostridium muellerianum TaxID=2716538 RepID=A0A7Y0EJM4_9CLOT|nr:Type 1 glutamine amidotransferase-like domain-containing protein [Clostridium muellerianum]NMM64684.1 type 1 glutamine amidotransferase-like domain-containing protein [Clostridium muellerianum]
MVNMLFSLYNFSESWAKDAVSKYINCNNKVLIIPFSFDKYISNDMDWQKEFNKNNGRHYKPIINPFLSYGVCKENIECINYFKDTKESAKDKIKNSDVIFFTGGLPDKTMCRLEEFDLIDDIENFNGTIMGSSAGAMIQIKDYHITPDEDYDIFSYNKGLNFIKDFDIEVHYKETEIQKNYINKVLNEKTDTVYALENTGGIIIDNNSITLLGDTHTFNR